MPRRFSTALFRLWYYSTMQYIDIHTHGISGHETRKASARDILEIARTHGKRGVSGIVPALYPSSIGEMRNDMTAIREAMALQHDHADRTEDEAEILGAYLEGPFLNPSQCGALDPQAFLHPSEENMRSLIDGFEDMIAVLCIAPELEGAADAIRAVSDRGIMVSMGHSDATYAEAEAGFHAGARGITHVFNAMRGMHHREPGIAGFALHNRDVFVEVIADPFHLHSAMIEIIFTVKKSDRLILISDSVKESATDQYSSGIRGRDNRLRGGTITVCDGVEQLLGMGLDREAVLKAATENPRAYLGSSLDMS